MKFETQKQRWVKYGLNVALSIVVVILLAGIVCYAAEKHDRRADMTLSRSYSLKPQTINVLNNLKQKITLVSLYPHKKEEGADDEHYQPVVDLLEEYQRHSPNIEIDAIDPNEERGKVEQLIDKVTATYSTEVKKYRDYLTTCPKTLKQLKDAADAEMTQVGKLPLDKTQETNLQTIVGTIARVGEILQSTKESIDRTLKEKLPNYKGRTSDLRNDLDTLSQLLGAVMKAFDDSKDNQKIAADVRDYIKSSIPRYQQMKKIADDEIAKIDALGELKLDALRESLRQDRSILVMGPHEIKVLSFADVWQKPNGRDVDPSVEVPMQFSGEQKITTAIWQMETNAKPKICFVRPGGQPLTGGMGQEGPLSEIAARLKDLGFEVTEKDLSGQWEMQAQMQQMPVQPEPSEEQIKDAIWVAVDFAPAMGQQGPNPLGPKLAAHLKQGGSAIVLANPQADDLSVALKDYGITLNTDAVAVHEMIKSSGEASNDAFEEAQRYPFIFVTTDYGNSPITSPLKSLEGLIIPQLPVSVTQVKDVKTTPILPVTRGIKTWGTHDLSVLEGKDVQPSPQDIPNTDAQPMYCGAIAEKGNSRVVVIGSLQFLLNRYLEMPDMEILRKQHRPVAKFPGNSELMTNACWWTAKMETMMAISPAAMQVSRIGPMSEAQQRFWKLGVLVIGLPSIVLLIGAGVYVSRRD